MPVHPESAMRGEDNMCSERHAGNTSDNSEVEPWFYSPTSTSHEI
jgi:hypothetical protein